MTPSVRVRVAATVDGLQILGPFGDLTVPYAAVSRVSRDGHSEITLDLSGAIMRLDCSGVPAMAVDAILDLLERKGPTRPQHT